MIKNDQELQVTLERARYSQQQVAHNHLATATSPYLRQHADNPVDWYPWGPEALARAQAEDKPIQCHRTWKSIISYEVRGRTSPRVTASAARPPA